ncbi:hypothetical protein ABL840_25400 [Variovorax sp. NFACC27]|uniref:hypothetical protein n=1 Tax=unclassified Variovorax TaxID=663243 RepID=UPI00115F8836
MSNPHSETEEEHLDAIEDELIERQVAFSQMMKVYAKFLHSRLLAGQFNGVASPVQLDFVVEHLQVAITSLGLDGSDELRRPGRLVLWSLFDSSEGENPGLAALSRCAVCCFYEEAEWDPNTSEGVTPVPLYLFLLKRFNPDLGLEFLRYACRYLLDPRQSE